MPTAIGGGPRRPFKFWKEIFDEPGQYKPNQPFILDMVTMEKMFLQTIPTSLDYTPESGWVAVAAPGRNNPLYQYTGSEDSLSFIVTWYSNAENREDVWKKIKWLEALSKNNGYDEKPHLIAFSFGSLFAGSRWIMYSVVPKFGMFNREIGMLPQIANTEITLKRVTEQNRSRAEILQLDT